VALMTARRATTATFEESIWAARPLNLDPVHGHDGLHDLYSIEIPLPDTGADTVAIGKATEVLLRYRIFPVHRMRVHVCTPDGRIRPGATIIQRVFLGPLAMEMGVRVVEVFDRRGDKAGVGFTYATLQGHSERGLATFSIHEVSPNTLVFRIESWSVPGNLLARLARPFARRTQQKSSRGKHSRSFAISVVRSARRRRLLRLDGVGQSRRQGLRWRRRD
jgi:uncharacterized protein (UPF0548 family)